MGFLLILARFGQARSLCFEPALPKVVLVLALNARLPVELHQRLQVQVVRYFQLLGQVLGDGFPSLDTFRLCILVPTLRLRLLTEHARVASVDHFNL